jgi:FemAB-related protein (PEP-CTERM system-associated)
VSEPALNPSALTVISVGEDLRSEWDAFVGARPEGSFYHLYDWKRLNEAEFGHRGEYLAARRAGVIEGVLPLVFVQSRVFGRILCSVPFMNYGGPIAATPEAAAALTARAAALAGELGADYLELRCAHPLTTDMPVSLRKVSMTIELAPDAETLWNGFSAKHRKNVRRAQKNELDTRIGGGELLDEFYAVLEQSWHSLGTPLYSKRYFQRVLATFPDNTHVYVCHHKGTPAGVALVGHFNGTVEGMWAGGVPALRHLQANYVLYWEMIRHTCSAGYRRFHLGRSTAESGAEQFKSKWNAETHQLYWYFHRPKGGAMPGLNVDNPKYKLAIAAWQRLPLWATRVLGPPLARGIP